MHTANALLSKDSVTYYHRQTAGVEHTRALAPSGAWSGKRQTASFSWKFHTVNT